MSRMLTDPCQEPSFHDVFSSFPEEIRLTNNFTIIHTDASKELRYGKYTIFVSGDIIHCNRKCKEHTKEAQAYDFKYRYNDYSLCPECWEETDKFKHKDLFEPEWYSYLHSLCNYVVEYKTPLATILQQQEITSPIKTFLTKNSTFAPKELASFNIVLSDIKNKVFIDDSLNIIHLDSTDNHPFGKYTFFRDVSTHIKKHSTYNHLYFPIAAYTLTDIDITMMCGECRRELSNYRDLYSPRWIRRYSFLKKQQEQNTANIIPSIKKEEDPKQLHMSKRIETEITCSECKKTYTDQLWHTVNTAENPEAKDLLLSGELFASVCPHCKQKLELNYAVLYFDTKSNFMCYYAPVKEEEEEQKAIKMFDSMTNNAIKRIVHNQQQLTEKAFIFSNNLDDRVIECVKLDVEEVFLKQMPSLTYDYLLLSTCGEVFSFLPEGQAKYHYELPKDNYKKLEDLYTKFQTKTNNEYIIDRKWAKKFIKGILDEIIPQILNNDNNPQEAPLNTIHTTPNTETKAARKKFSFNKVTATIATLCILLCSSIGINLYQTYSNAVLQDNITTLENKIERKDSSTERLVERNNELNIEIDDLKDNLSFYERYVVIIPDNNTYKYHIYGCKYCDTSRFWIYSIDDAKERGFSSCDNCCKHIEFWYNFRKE